jgi:hypothetical protein
MPPHGWRARYGFALAYLICFAAADLVYVLLSPHAQAVVTAWASTNVANLEHEPVLPLVLSMFVAPGHFGAWPLLIALAVFGANRALGSARTALVCVAGHVVGTLVSEGIVAYRVDAGLLPVADRYLVDVGPSYVVVAAIVVAVLAGTWSARVLALADFAVLVTAGDIFGGLSQLDVAAVGHVTSIITALTITTALLATASARRKTPAGQETAISAGRVPDRQPDEIGDRGGSGPEYELP